MTALDRSQLVTSWAPKSRKQRLLRGDGDTEYAQARRLAAATTPTLFTVVAVLVVIDGALLFQAGLSDLSAISTLASQGIGDWAAAPSSAFSQAWKEFTGVASAIYVGAVTMETPVSAVSGLTATTPRDGWADSGAVAGVVVGVLVGLAAGRTFFVLLRRKYLAKPPPQLSPKAVWPRHDIYEVVDVSGRSRSGSVSVRSRSMTPHLSMAKSPKVSKVVNVDGNIYDDGDDSATPVFNDGENDSDCDSAAAVRLDRLSTADYLRHLSLVMPPPTSRRSLPRELALAGVSHSPSICVRTPSNAAELRNSSQVEPPALAGSRRLSRFTPLITPPLLATKTTAFSFDFAGKDDTPSTANSMGLDDFEI